MYTSHFGECGISYPRATTDMETKQLVETKREHLVAFALGGSKKLTISPCFDLACIWVWPHPLWRADYTKVRLHSSGFVTVCRNIIQVFKPLQEPGSRPGARSYSSTPRYSSQYFSRSSSQLTFSFGLRYESTTFSSLVSAALPRLSAHDQPRGCQGWTTEPKSIISNTQRCAVLAPGDHSY